MNEIEKNYSNDEITVVWKAHLCQHAAECVKNAPNTFRPQEKPWVDANASDSETIRQAVKKCPSGALTYFENPK